MKKKDFMLYRSMLRLAAVFAASLLVVSSAFADTFTIPTGVVTIEDSAFEGASSLTVVKIPQSVTTIGANAFASCNGITDIYIEGDDVFFGENALGTRKEIVLHGSPDSSAKEYADQYGMKFVSTNAASLLLAYADTQIDTSYSDHDCVTYVRECYIKALGIIIHDTCVGVEQKTAGVRIDSIEDLRPGDIICWKNDSVDYCTHVGMYVGEGVVKNTHYSSGVFIESSAGAGIVRYNYIAATGTSYYTRNFMGAWRII